MSFHRILGVAMKWLLVGLVPAFLMSCAHTQSKPTIAAGDARFEFLTPTLVRMEYSSSGTFVDAPTAVVQKRDWPAVHVKSTEKDGWLIATTDAMTLRYRLHSGAFTAANLKVTWSNPAGSVHEWRPGDMDSLNLGGLTYSLDNISKPNLPEGQMDLESPVNDIIPGIDVLLAKAKPGLLSRNGYAFIDDSQTPVWNARKTWIEPRPQTNGQDWYLFTYNRDYRKVFNEYAQLCGPIPMIPRYTLGPWITDFNFEYFPDTAESRQPAFKRYNQQHLEDEVSRLRENHIPFDTLVLDFAWHNYGWQGGYDWSPLIPHPDQLLNWLHSQGVKVSLNDHPGYANTDESILSFSDSHAPEVLHALGRPLPAKPSLDMDISKHWKFSTDPHDQGLRNHWFAKDHDDAHWKPIHTGMPWQDQGYRSYRGIAWYRTSVRLPAVLPDALYVYLGEVGQTYRIFVNGKEVPHSQIQWPRRLTYADIASYVKAGQQNEIALRVVPGQNGGGILRGPVAIRNVEPPKRIYFDLSNQEQADIFMRELHKPLMQQGVDVWWVDGGGGAVDMPGLNRQLWTNKVFYDYTQQETGQRGFILSRYGDWGSERYPAFFTGDTYSQWPVLAYEVAFTARGGNVLVPYISHDIGGFHGARIDFDLYARWIEFGTFSPILRMHSAHANPREGNVRMPWVYGDQGIALMKKYFTLRTQLIPYTYTYTWLAHTQSMPILRPLYLQYPDLEEAYRHSHEYFFGEEMLVAPVLDDSGNRTVYLPPGQWIDFFTGKHYEGGTTFTAHYAVDEMPVFVREGSIIPEQSVSDYSNAQPLDHVILNVYGSGKGSFELYEDDGISLAYSQGQYALTPMTYATSSDGSHQLVIEPTKGSFAGQVQARSYELRIHAANKPLSISVNGSNVSQWTWNAKEATATVMLPKQAIQNRISVKWL
ncbi:glycoside hydrolase family 31 protein [Rhodanobacter koreensis]